MRKNAWVYFLGAVVFFEVSQKSSPPHERTNPETTIAPNNIAQMPAKIARLRGSDGRMLLDGGSYDGRDDGRELGRALGRCDGGFGMTR
jgi:hypothetical protein